MSNQITGHSVHSVGQIGAANNGKIVHFEFIDPNGQKARYLVPYDRMSSVLAGLQSAMQIATEENAKRPGFNPAQTGLKTGLKNYGTGQALAPGKDPLVVLYLQTKSAIALDLGSGPIKIFERRGAV